MKQLYKAHIEKKKKRISCDKQLVKPKFLAAVKRAEDFKWESGALFSVLIFNRKLGQDFDS